MRIWAKKIIPVLPTKQLIAMRYELGDMIKQYPNIKNPLVKFANNYDICYLDWYLKIVRVQCALRGIKQNETYNKEIDNIVAKKTKEYVGGVKFKEDNEEYLKICYWNLYEKAIRGVISDEEWRKIEDLIGGEIK